MFTDTSIISVFQEVEKGDCAEIISCVFEENTSEQELYITNWQQNYH
jgi:hypothetical protein